MPSVAELSAPYGNFMFGPRRGRDVCETCFNFTQGYRRCYGCAHNGDWLAAVAPLSYSVASEQLHRALWGYKHLSGDVGRRLTVELAAVLWRYLAQHERCVARAADVETFELITTVPSSSADRDKRHPLRTIVGELTGPTRDRYEPLLTRTETPVPAREASRQKYGATRRLHHESVLLIDDTWTTGANAQSAAVALREGGAGAVAAVVIGRHVNRDWHENDRRLRELGRPFDWDHCALCQDAGSGGTP
jgi:predicted amidophosphoribosyltransferase